MAVGPMPRQFVLVPENFRMVLFGPAPRRVTLRVCAEIMSDVDQLYVPAPRETVSPDGQDVMAEATAEGVAEDVSDVQIVVLAGMVPAPAAVHPGAG
jgi:hypothetical protein